MKICISQELEKGYDHWKKIFDSLESLRQEAGISTIVVAREAENSKQNTLYYVNSLHGSDQRIYDAT